MACFFVVVGSLVFVMLAQRFLDPIPLDYCHFQRLMFRLERNEVGTAPVSLTRIGPSRILAYERAIFSVMTRHMATLTKSNN